MSDRCPFRLKYFEVIHSYGAESSITRECALISLLLRSALFYIKFKNMIHYASYLLIMPRTIWFVIIENIFRTNRNLPSYN